MFRPAFILLVFVSASGLAWGQEDLSYFRTVLDSDNTEAKRNVLLQIRELKSEEASRVATKALRDRNEIVRATAASSIIGLPPAEAVTVLTPLLRDRSPFVRTEAAYVLGNVGYTRSKLPLLVEILQKDAAKEARAAAAISLGTILDVAAVGPLTAVFKKSPSEDNEFIRRSAARSIGKIAVTVRALLASHNAGQAFTGATETLIKVLQSSKESDDTRREAAIALGAIGHRDAIPTLNSHLNSPDYYLVEICKKAIAAIEQGQ